MSNAKRIVLIADAYPPMRSSAAVQLRDLSIELVSQGYFLLVLIPSSEIISDWILEEVDGVQVLRLRALRTKDVNYIIRTMNEFLLPFFMLRNFRKSPFKNNIWDGVVWYSPSIFLGPIVNSLKKQSHCKSYLILRDIFPEWAVDMGILRRSLPYYFFKLIEKYQYSVADVIGIQTPTNSEYFERKHQKVSKKLEVLPNWLSKASDEGCSISVKNTVIAGRKIFVYAGNMGVAQGMQLIFDMVVSFQSRSDVGFLFVGRGSEAQKMRAEAKERGLSNVVFFDEIDPREIPGLYAQCDVGIVTLDRRHKTHNIPGKFLSYLQSGLPVLASVNSGNDLIDLIQENRIGRVCIEHSVQAICKEANDLLVEINFDNTISERASLLSEDLYSTKKIVSNLTLSLFS